MKAQKAGQKAANTFERTSNKGDYRNSPKFTPRGGRSMK